MVRGEQPCDRVSAPPDYAEPAPGGYLTAEQLLARLADIGGLRGIKQ
jgi:hypothetical protein